MLPKDSTPTTLLSNLTNLLKHLYIFEKRPYPSSVVLQWFHWGFIEFLANLAVINDVADICWVCRRYPIGMVSEKVYSISNCLQLQQRWSEIQFDDPLSLHLKGRYLDIHSISQLQKQFKSGIFHKIQIKDSRLWKENKSFINRNYHIGPLFLPSHSRLRHPLNIWKERHDKHF